MDYTKIGENIDIVRKQRGLTKSALAEKMECTRPVVLRHIREGRMSLEYLTRYAEVLGCSVGDLTDGVTDPEEFHLTADILSYYPYNLIAAVLFREYDKEDLEKVEEVRQAVYKVYVPAFEASLHELKEREREILRMRYENGMTLVQCGKKYNVTSNRIRQLENKALRRMRRPGSEGSWTFETVSSMAEVTKEISRLKAENSDIRSQLAMLSEKVSQYEKKEAEEAAARRKRDIPIEKLELPTRIYNSLKRADIDTLVDLKGKTMSELMGIRNLGNKALEEVLKKMADYGVSPKEEEEEEK